MAAGGLFSVLQSLGATGVVTTVGVPVAVAGALLGIGCLIL